jgi:hypothetical protein
MRGARHPAGSLGTGMLAVALVAILASGCGSSSTNSSREGSTKTAAPPGAVVLSCASTPAGVGALRVSGTGCPTGRDVVASWTAKDACATPAGTSRTSCTVGSYRCLTAATERGLAVSCARPGSSISFVAKHR